jgi:phenylacetate-CoA ligase
VNSSARRQLTGRFLFPLSNLLSNRRGILPAYASLRRSERLSRDELTHLQLQRLRSLISWVQASVPCYARVFASAGLRAQDIRDLSDLRRIPTLSREFVQEHALDLVEVRSAAWARMAARSRRPPGEPVPLALFRANRIVRNTSSGSTGSPTMFFEDGSRSALSWAHELRAKSWFGVRPGAPEVRLQRVATSYEPHSLRVMLRALVWNQLLVPGTFLAESDYALTARAAARFQPEVLWGYTSSLTGLAEYLETHDGGGEAIRPRLVVTWAAPLYGHEEQRLRRVFQCPVTNIYGSREVGHVAARCPNGTLHVNDENLLVEVDAAAPGGEGELLVTTLDPSPMPFIRYRMGDLAVLSEAPCGCGRTLSVIASLLGRTGEVFHTRDGRMISPNFWCRVFMSGELVGAVARFQVVYTQAGDMQLRVERAAGWRESAERYVRRVVAEHFGTRVRVGLEFPPRITPDASGKYQMIVNQSASVPSGGG